MLFYTQNCNCDAIIMWHKRVPATREDRKWKHPRFIEWWGRKNLKHILVYSCAGDWISYTAGSMPFMSKATKKCNNGVDHSLHLVSSVFCVDLKTIYRVQIYVRTISKKKKKKKKTGKPKTNTTIYLWENYLKLPSFSSHKAWQNLTSSTMTTVQSGSSARGGNCRDSYRWRTMAPLKFTDCSEGSKTNCTDTFSI